MTLDVTEIASPRSAQHLFGSKLPAPAMRRREGRCGTNDWRAFLLEINTEIRSCHQISPRLAAVRDDPPRRGTTFLDIPVFASLTSVPRVGECIEVWRHGRKEFWANDAARRPTGPAESRQS